MKNQHREKTDTQVIHMTMAVAPRYQDNCRKAIERILLGLRSKYLADADGILLSWSKLKILNDKGIILDDQPYIFWNIAFEARIFKPTEGKIAKGKITQIMKSYFLCKALDSFTVTVSIPESASEHEIVKNLILEQEIFFRIKGSSEGVYRGELDEECLSKTMDLDQKDISSGDLYDYAKDFEY